MLGWLSNSATIYGQNSQTPCKDNVGCLADEQGACNSTQNVSWIGRNWFRFGKVTAPQTCEEGCTLEIKEEKEKKTCFKTEEKTICIPPVQLPFPRFCKPLLAKTKTIKVLKEDTYESPITKYTWKKPKPPKASVDANAPAKAAMQIRSSNDPSNGFKTARPNDPLPNQAFDLMTAPTILPTSSNSGKIPLFQPSSFMKN